MDQQKTFDLVRTRAADIRMIVMTFTISHAALMIVGPPHIAELAPLLAADS